MPVRYASTQIVHMAAAAMAARAGRGSWPGPCDALASSSQSPVPAASKVIISTAARAGSRASALTVAGSRQVIATAMKAASRIVARAPGSRDRPPPGVQQARADHELHGGRRGRVHAGCPPPRPEPADRSAEGPDDYVGRQAVVWVLQASLKQHLVTVSYGPHILARQLAFGAATSYAARQGRTGYCGRYRRKRNPSCSHSDRICQPDPDGRAGPARIRLAPPPGQQRGHGEAQLIQQACRRELPVQSRAALREHAGISSFGQCAERGCQIHIPLPGDDHVGAVGGLLALERRRFGDGDHDRRHDRGGEEGGIPVELAGTGEHRHGNVQRPVMFRANGSGRDEYDICLGAEYREQRLVGGAAQAAGHAGNRGGAVNAGDHVEPH